MATFEIHDSELQGLRGTIIVATGGSSGLGLASVSLLLSLGAKVVIGDCQRPPLTNEDLTFVQVDVTSWKDLTQLFKTAHSKYDRVDHVFANAATPGRTTYTEEDLDENGDLKEPDNLNIHVNLIGVANTVKLANYYLKKNPNGGSIVLTASVAGYIPFGDVDYCAAKHGVIGLMRGLAGHVHPKIPIRVNTITPSWTETGLVTSEVAKAAGLPTQPPIVVARSVALLMVDAKRNQQIIYSAEGIYKEIAGVLSDASGKIRLRERSEDDDLTAFKAYLRSQGLLKGH